MTTLYKTNKNGSIQQWSIEVSGPTFTCIYGQVGGKLQSQQTICKSVNIGKSNETTPEQQAQLESAALIAKKSKSGYFIRQVSSSYCAVAYEGQSLSGSVTQHQIPLLFCMQA